MKTPMIKTESTEVGKLVEKLMTSVSDHKTALRELLKLYDRVTTGKDGGYGVKEVLRLNEIRLLAQ